MKVLTNIFFYFAGIFFLGLSKVKNIILGYTSPKPIVDEKKCIDYSFSVVDGWMSFASGHFDGFSIKDKVILELGPGSDLGTGVVLLGRGARKYYAFDVNNLEESISLNHYMKILRRLSEDEGVDEDLVADLAKDIEEQRGSGWEREGLLNYIVKNEVDFDELDRNSIDIVFSQATLEHFQDVEAMLLRLKDVCNDGCVFIAEIDLAAHSRWIRDVDPLNIYRYSDIIYGLLAHGGSPNRVRPSQYMEAMEKAGWRDIRVIPLTRAPHPYFDDVSGYMLNRFQDAQLDHLSIILVARR